MPIRLTRRGLLATMGAASSGALVSSLFTRRGVAQADDAVTIDRTLGEDVFLPPTATATVTGTSTFDPGAELEVRLTTGGASPVVLSRVTVVADDGTWSARFDLAEFTEGTEFTIVVYFRNDPIVRAPGIIRSLRAAIQFPDQVAQAEGAGVVVDAVTLEVGGFVAIHEGSVSGPLIGVSQLLEPGQTYAALEIPLARAIIEPATLVATPHIDTNRNQTFDPAQDYPYFADGDRVRDTATVQGPSPTVTSTIEPTPTATPDGNGPRFPLDLVIGGGGGVVGTLVLREARNRFDTNNHPPEARIWYSPNDPEPGRPIVFDGRGSVDPDDTIVGYRWSIDGDPSMAPRFVHSFPKAGEYDVSLQVTDGHQNTDSQTETITVEAHAGEFELARVHPDAPGDDHANLTQEYLVFENAGDEALDLAGWTIHDAAQEENRVRAGEHTFTFASEFELAPGGTVTIHTGGAPNEENRPRDLGTDHHCYWAKSRAVWNNEQDIIVVADDRENPVLAKRYKRTADDSYELEDLDMEIFTDWFPSVVISTRENASLVDVSVDEGFLRSWVTGLLGFIMGSVLLRGPGAFLWSWTAVTGFVVSFSATWMVATGMGVVAPSIDPFVLLGVSLPAVGMMVVSGVVWLGWTAVAKVWGWLL